MSETKKALGRKSRQLGKENRVLIFVALTMKPMTFSQLLKETKLSRATLTQHLKQLQKDGLVERSIDNRTYSAKKDEDLIVEELKRTLSLYELFATKVGREKFDAFLRDLAKDIMKYGKEEAFKKRIPEKEKPAETEQVWMFNKSKIEKLRAKYPDAMKELLGE